MSAIEKARQAIKEIEIAQEGCLHNGCVRDCYRYRYQILERDKYLMKESLDWMVKQKHYK